MVNGLGRTGRLTPDEETWCRATNALLDRAYPDPSTVDPECYDPALHPGARSWFRPSATDLLELTEGYLLLLDRHGLPWTELRTTSPGRITYQDEHQVVAAPWAFADDWPFTPHQGDRRA